MPSLSSNLVEQPSVPVQLLPAIVSWMGDWRCSCGSVNQLWNSCACGNSAPCRNYVRGHCNVTKCIHPHPIFSIPPTIPRPPEAIACPPLLPTVCPEFTLHPSPNAPFHAQPQYIVVVNYSHHQANNLQNTAASLHSTFHPSTRTKITPMPTAITTTDHTTTTTSDNSDSSNTITHQNQQQHTHHLCIVSWLGHWQCNCGKVSKLWDACPTCNHPPPCRDWVRGHCSLPQCRYPHPLFAIPPHIPKPPSSIANPKPEHMLVTASPFYTSSASKEASNKKDAESLDAQNDLIKSHGVVNQQSSSSSSSRVLPIVPSSPPSASSSPMPSSPTTPSATMAKTAIGSEKAASAVVSPPTSPSSPLFVSAALLAQQSTTSPGKQQQQQHNTNTIDNAAGRQKQQQAVDKTIPRNQSKKPSPSKSTQNERADAKSKQATTMSSFRMALLKKSAKQSTSSPASSLMPPSSLSPPKGASSASSSLSQETGSLSLVQKSGDNTTTTVGTPSAISIAGDYDDDHDDMCGDDDDMRVEREISFTAKDQIGMAAILSAINNNNTDDGDTNNNSTPLPSSPAPSLFDLPQDTIHSSSSSYFDPGLTLHESSLLSSSFSSASLPMPLLHSSSWSSLDPVISSQSSSLYNSLSQQQTSLFTSSSSLPVPQSSSPYLYSHGSASMASSSLPMNTTTTTAMPVNSANDAAIAALFAQSLSLANNNHNTAAATTASGFNSDTSSIQLEHTKSAMSPVLQSIVHILLDADLIHPAFHHALTSTKVDFLPDGHGHFHDLTMDDARARQHAWNSAVDEYKLLIQHSKSSTTLVDDIDIAAKISLHGGALYCRCHHCSAPLCVEESIQSSLINNNNASSSSNGWNHHHSNNNNTTTNNNNSIDGCMWCPSCHSTTTSQQHKSTSMSSSNKSSLLLLPSQHALRIALELVLMKGIVDKHVLQYTVMERMEKYSGTGSDVVNSVAASIINDIDDQH